MAGEDALWNAERLFLEKVGGGVFGPVPAHAE
jgi:hypothetical protein